MFKEGAIDEADKTRSFLNDSDELGALVTFSGIVRADQHGGQTVKSISFTAHQEIAESVCTEILEEAKAQFQLGYAKVLHSIGEIEVGECCFWVAVASGHRSAGFEAIRYVVDAVKARCPIFGKEIFNSGGYKWKQNTEGTDAS